MDAFDSTYAPQSPDLSEYQTGDNNTHTYNNEGYQPPSHVSAQGYGQQESFYPPADFQPHHYNSAQSFPDPYSADAAPPQDQQHDPYSQSHDPYSQQQPAASEPPQKPTQGRGRPPKVKTEDGNTDPAQPKAKPGPRSKKPKKEEEPECTKPAPGTVEGVEVKTKFPVARIKRIMQADEDVGKVSQVTPTAMSKALELFIIALTLKSADVARAKSTKRVTASHLKQAVQGDEQFDFLEAIVSRIPDIPPPSAKPEGGKKKAAAEASDGEDSSDDGDYADTKPKKRAPRRKRKVAADDDDD